MGLLDGLMNDPASLGLLSAGTNMMAASGPSRMPVGIGSVLAQGLQGAAGGYQGAINNQYDRVSKGLQLQNLMYQANKSGLLNSILQGAFSGQQGQQTAPAPSAAPQTGGTGVPVLDAGGLPRGPDGSGPGVASAPVPNVGATPQTPQADASAAPQPQPAPSAAPQASGLFGSIPTQQAGLALALSPDKLVDSMLAQYAPTDFQKLLRASGIDPNSTIGKQLLQQQVAKQNNMPLQAFRGGGYAYNPATQSMQQLPQVPEGYTAAQGPNGWQIVPVAGATDAIASSAAAKTGGEGRMLPFSGVDAQGNPLPVTNRTAAATGGSFGNQPPPIPTLPGLGGAPAQGGSPVPLPGGPLPSGASGGAIYAAPPMGSVANANDAQAAPAQTMKDSYSKLQSGNSTANAALEALQKMQQLASSKTVLSTGPLGTLSTPINPSAAEYEKQRANVITLLANQNGTNGTDAGRALTGESVPDYGKPTSAIQDGLGTLVNQVKVGQLKANFLTPAYNAGDSKSYTHLENQFDQNISPSMMPLLTMQAGPARAAALKQAAQNPQMRSRLEWAVQNGVLK